VRTACSRSLCTCNFAKSVHFPLLLAVYHPYFDCLDPMITVYLHFFACSRRWNAETALGRREAAKKLADTLVLDSGREAAGDSRQDSGGGCLGCRREGRRQLAQLPPEWMDSAGCCSGGGLGCPGRLGLKRLGRLASRRSGVDGSGGAARMAQLTDDGNGSPNGHTCLVRVKVRVKGRRSVARGRGAGHVRQGEGSSRRWESSGSGGGG